MQVAAELRRAYPGMGKALFFEIAKNTHAVVYELPQKRLNWLWCVMAWVLQQLQQQSRSCADLGWLLHRSTCPCAQASAIHTIHASARQAMPPADKLQQAINGRLPGAGTSTSQSRS